MTETRDDHQLMTDWNAGDVAAFDVLYERHRRGLFRFVQRLMGPSGAALVDEVYQEAWLRVIHQRQHWLPQGASFKTWLYTLAHHHAVDILRKRRPEVPLGSAQPDEAVSSQEPPFEPSGAAWSLWPAVGSSPAQDEALFWRRAGARLLTCLNELPLSQRAVFLMHHDDGESVQAIADALNLGFETAKSRLRYAMSKLKTCMGAYLDPLQTLGSDRP